MRFENKSRTMEKDEEQAASLLENISSEDTQTSSHSSGNDYDSHKIVFTLTIFMSVFTIGGYMLVIPLTRVYEDIICHRYHEALKGATHVDLNDYLDERNCKKDEIQSELAFVNGISHALSAIPGVFLSLPYGLLADKIGRKLVCFIAIVGNFLCLIWILIVCWWWKVLPLRLIWLGPIFKCIGGGDIVASTMVFTIICDVTLQEERSSAFFRITVGTLLGGLVSPLVASKLMDTSPWLPILTGIGILILGTSLIAIIPETVHLRSMPVDEKIASESFVKNKYGQPTKPKSTNIVENIRYGVAMIVFHARESAAALTSLPPLLLLSTFFVRPIVENAINFSPQYISQRFSWTLQATGYLLSLRSFINILLVLVFLPAISHILISKKHGYHLTNQKKDVFLARLSSVVLFLGALLIAGPSIFISLLGITIYTLGTGLDALKRSLLTTLVEAQHVAWAYSAAAVAETLGALVAGPGVAVLWDIGLKWKGDWLSLPFLGAAVLCAVVSVIVCAVRIPETKVARRE